MKEAIQKGGLSDLARFTPHGLRHTWLSTAIRNGMDTRTMMAYSGHTNLATVQKYAHLVSSPERMRDDATKFIRLPLNTVGEISFQTECFQKSSKEGLVEEPSSSKKTDVTH